MIKTNKSMNEIDWRQSQEDIKDFFDGLLCKYFNKQSSLENELVALGDEDHVRWRTVRQELMEIAQTIDALRNASKAARRAVTLVSYNEYL